MKSLLTFAPNFNNQVPTKDAPIVYNRLLNLQQSVGFVFFCHRTALYGRLTHLKSVCFIHMLFSIAMATKGTKDLCLSHLSLNIMISR